MMQRLHLAAMGLATLAGLGLAADTPQKEDQAIKQIDAAIASAKVNKQDTQWRTKLAKPEPVKFDSAHSYFANVTTSEGPIRIKFMPDVAPMHVTSFIYLSKLGYFDGLSFHRVIPGFMAQGGCPLGTGTGSPGYYFDGEFSPKVKHDRPGLLSMANRGPNTDGSQFFLTFVPTPHLDGKHTIYGEVVDGRDTLKKIEALGSQSGATKQPVKIEKVTIEVS
jgi:cyclophilin family peptidyl-prolyl cis-trans isomerase